MTKDRLLEYRSKKDEISELDYRLSHRWEDEGLIGNDVVFDYRSGYPMPQSVVGFDYEKYERLQDRDLRRKDQLTQECEEIEEWIEAIPDSLTRRIFRMRFIDGRRQKDVAKAVHLEKSSVSKKINHYLQLSPKSTKSHL